MTSQARGDRARLHPGRCLATGPAWGQVVIVDLFAGAGGWDEAVRHLQLGPVAGIELDPVVGATRTAAGHATIRADVAGYPTGPFAGRVKGLIASPPCQPFSVAARHRARGLGTRRLGSRGAWQASAASPGQRDTVVGLAPEFAHGEITQLAGRLEREGDFDLVRRLGQRVDGAQERLRVSANDSRERVLKGVVRGYHGSAQPVAEAGLDDASRRLDLVDRYLDESRRAVIARK